MPSPPIKRARSRSTSLKPGPTPRRREEEPGGSTTTPTPTSRNDRPPTTTTDDQNALPPAPRSGTSREQLPSIASMLPPLDLRQTRPHTSHLTPRGSSSSSSGGSARLPFGRGDSTNSTSSPSFPYRGFSDDFQLSLDSGRTSTSASGAATPFMYQSPREMPKYQLPSATSSHPPRDMYRPLPMTSPYGSQQQQQQQHQQHQQQQQRPSTSYIPSPERDSKSSTASSSRPSHHQSPRFNTSPYVPRIPDDVARNQAHHEEMSGERDSKRMRLPGPDVMQSPYANEYRDRDRILPFDPRQSDPRYSPFSSQSLPTTSASYGQSSSDTPYRYGMSMEGESALEIARRQREPSESGQRSGEEAEQRVSGQRVLKRTYQACIRCRTKKLKCDSRLPRCTPCSNAQTECQQADVRRQTSYPRGYVENLEETCQVQEQILRRLVPDIPPSRYKELLVVDSARMEDLEGKLFGTKTSGPSARTRKVEGLLLTGTTPYGS